MFWHTVIVIMSDRHEIRQALEEVGSASQQCSLLSQQHQGLLQRHQADMPDADPLADQVLPPTSPLHAALRLHCLTPHTGLQDGSCLPTIR